MKITKDEAYLLASALCAAKYGMCKTNAPRHEDAVSNMGALDAFQKKLEAFAIDKRRLGRTSVNFSEDIIGRVINKYKILK